MAKYTIEFNGAGKLLDGDKVSIQGSYNGTKTFTSLLGSDDTCSIITVDNHSLCNAAC